MIPCLIQGGMGFLAGTGVFGIYDLRYHGVMARTLSRDTSPEAEAIQLRVLRGLSAWRKLQLVEESSRLTRTLIEAGIRARHPEASGDEVRYRVHVAILGEALAEAVYGAENQSP